MSETKSENGYEGNDKTVVVNNPFSKLESKMKVLTDVNDTDSDENEENDNDNDVDDDDDTNDEEEGYDDDNDDEINEDENDVDDEEEDEEEDEDDDDDDDGVNDKTFFPQEGEEEEEEEDDGKSIDGSSDTLLKSYILEQKSYMKLFHPECSSISFDEVKALSVVIRDSTGIVIDPLHRTIPILTKYEKARIIGLRSYHLDDGDEPYISDVRLIAGMSNSDIAVLELKMKLLPYIIRRPFPDGKFEYWKLSDLEMF
jgi:DNA-directed RNA polymerase subunit K/omega